MTEQVLTSPALFDDDGNMTISAKDGLYVVLDFHGEDITDQSFAIDVDGKFNKPLAVVDGETDKLAIILTPDDAAKIPNKGALLRIIDRTRVIDNVVIPQTIFKCTIFTYGTTTPSPPESNP